MPKADRVRLGGRSFQFRDRVGETFSLVREPRDRKRIISTASSQHAAPTIANALKADLDTLDRIVCGRSSPKMNKQLPHSDTPYITSPRVGSGPAGAKPILELCEIDVVSAVYARSRSEESGGCSALLNVTMMSTAMSAAITSGEMMRPVRGHRSRGAWLARRRVSLRGVASGHMRPRKRRRSGHS